MSNQEADREQAHRGREDAFLPLSPVWHLRCASAELVGTLLIVFVTCGGAVIGSLAPLEVTSAARAAATGLVIMSMIYVLGDVSGAHFNPAVTAAFVLRRVFPWQRVPLYWGAQAVGALLGAAILRALFGDVGRLGVAQPGLGAPRAFVFELALTFVRVLVVLGTATRHRMVGANAAIASGGADTLCAAFSRPVSGAAMNPARALGPAVVSGHTAFLWIYLTAPFAGALVAVGVMCVVHPHRRADEPRVAGGGKE